MRVLSLILATSDPRHRPAKPPGYSRSTTLGRHTPALNPTWLATETRETQQQIKHPNQRAPLRNDCRNGSTFATSEPLPITAPMYPIRRGLVKTSKEKKAQMFFCGVAVSSRNGGFRSAAISSQAVRALDQATRMTDVGTSFVTCFCVEPVDQYRSALSSQHRGRLAPRLPDPSRRPENHRCRRDPTARPRPDRKKPVRRASATLRSAASHRLLSRNTLEIHADAPPRLAGQPPRKAFAARPSATSRHCRVTGFEP